MARRLVSTLATAVVATLLLSACGTSEGDDDASGPAVTGVQVKDDDGYQGIFLDEPYAIPAVKLTDTEGRPFDLAAQTKRTLVFFGYTNCPDICQVVMSTIASAVARLDDAEQDRVQVVFVTTDPARDTAAVMRKYLDRYNPEFLGVTGSLDQVDELGKPLGIFIKKGQKLPSGGYEVDHTTNVISVADGVGDLVWTASTSQSDVAEDLEKQLKADS